MEYEPRTPTRPTSEGLQLPKGTLEAGLGRDNVRNPEKKVAKKKRAARVPLGHDVVAPDASQESGGHKARSSEAVNTWKRLVRSEAEEKPTVPTAEKPAPRQAEDATLLEGSGEIPLQADRPPDMPPPVATWLQQESAPEEADDVDAEVPEHLTNALDMPLKVSAVQNAGVHEKTKPRAEWLQAETVGPQTPSAERIASKPLDELLAVPAAAAALKSAGAKAGAERLDMVPAARHEAAMDRTDIMELSKTIMVDGVSLHGLFESRQIDEEGLRSVVETYLRGGDVSRQLQQEIVEKQKQFERDPFNRKRSSRGSGNRQNSSTGKLADTSSNFARVATHVAGRAGKSIAGGARQAQQKLADGSEVQQWAGIGAVVVIWAIILILVLG